MKKFLALLLLLALAPELAHGQMPGMRPASGGGSSGCVYWLAPPVGGTSLLNGTGSPFQCDAKGNLRIVNMDAAGNARGANVTAAFELLIGGSGTAGTASTAVQTVQGIAGMTKLLVTPDSVALPANQSVNVAQINGITPLMGNGGTGTGSPRVTLASDGTAISTAGFMSVKIDQTTPGTTNLVALGANQSVNVAQINGVTPLMGNGATGTGSPRVTIASDGTAISTTGYMSVKLDQTTPGTTNAVTTVPATTGGLSTFFLQPAASDNHATIKAGAGQIYHVTVTNNSTTINYLRFYNATTGFNGCNSATNLVWQTMIPAAASGGAGFVQDIGQGIPFSTGISICVTSGYATTDTTNATASAMSVLVGYK